MQSLIAAHSATAIGAFPTESTPPSLCPAIVNLLMADTAANQTGKSGGESSDLGSARISAVKNQSLGKARDAKQDEFYTQLSDIERELKHYKKYFRNKIVYCNCDDPRVSNFFHYFSYNFDRLGLKKLITTCYKSQNCDLFSQHDSERAIHLAYSGGNAGTGVPEPEEIGIQYLKSDGDFRSEESLALLKSADIVVTNPPFSLFRE